jgi:arsenate reductase
MKKVQVFGIPNCASVKKARQWLADHGVEHEFHDFKKQGLLAADLDRWLKHVEWQVLLNRKGTTWRGLPVALQQAVIDQASARQAMLAHPSLVKRPVWESAGKVVVGVNPEAWSNVI